MAEWVYAELPPEAEIYDGLDRPKQAGQAYDPDDPIEAARQPFEAGVKAQNEERWADASRAFRDSWSLRKTVNCAGRLAEVSMHLERYRDALYYISFLRASKNTPDGLRQSAEGWERRATAFAARLNIQAEAGACITVDGLTVGLAPLARQVVVDGGACHVEAHHDNKHASERVSVVPGGSMDVPLKLK